PILKTECASAAVDLELLGVVDDDAAFAQVLEVVVVRVLVLRDEDIEVIAGREDGLTGDASLPPRGATLDLRRERGERENVVTALRGRGSHQLRASDHTLSAFPRKADNEILAHRVPLIPAPWILADMAPGTDPMAVPGSIPPGCVLVQWWTRMLRV